ncbi:hydroxymethylglutaryl-CoA reductase, degradative [Salegentibacter sp. JZCK2]|uniref:hydroxymethylglutaryl-CoA reductase, degradative n=1 Tax=Salegentibacter tibetensis TaxID=2873600 RepID=UPI001CCD7E35|nr:hydroxymethylglutaryl-CoA reductase, degradative [Salegentibacter tibetensis]MBZ9730716.1 hydroxymethylglutaryl-CoA reductase, degradative [Salegentibacter tibetensis]
MIKPISGFSKLNKKEKIDWLAETYLKDRPEDVAILRQYWNEDSRLQQLHDEFTENTLSNFYLPFGLAPNFLINGDLLAIPMAIEESSVIAAASKAAKFWRTRGGFKAEVIDTKKIGQVHFNFFGNNEKLEHFFETTKPKLLKAVKPITRNMEKRGGGILDIKLKDKTAEIANYYQLHCEFETKDSMGANFINSCLEKFAEVFQNEAQQYTDFSSEEKDIEIIMSILSNYVPECLVRAEVSCPVEDLDENKDLSGEDFAKKFIQAVNIAEVEPYRAVTHNKGIMNGIDAVVLATGNDFRAVEAGIHAYAARNGKYSSLTHASIKDGIFKFWIEIPLALGTVGGLTSLHPLVKLALDILQQPTARELMKVVAVAGLAQNFAAINSLTTTGIQQGHMKMHLMNILNQYNATAAEKKTLTQYFTKHTVTHSSAVEELKKLRSS